jgi:hypothetical protein
MAMGFWGMVAPPAPDAAPSAACPHVEVHIDEAVELGVKLFGGSWQTWFDKLSKRGIKLMRHK